MNDTLSAPVETIDLGVDLESLLDDDTPDNVAHIVKRQGEMSAQQVIALAVATGTEVVGLCGWRWRPLGLASDDLPACKRCVEAWQTMMGAGQ